MTRFTRAREPRWSLADAVEGRLMRRLTRRRSRSIDQLLIKLSQLGEHSVLWLILAAAFAARGGERGRRAAGNGLLALMCASATVHSLKLILGRRRPAPHRFLYRRPRTASFPSGHAASGFAFAVAASRELPEAGALLLPLAATVAYSRVYLGAHYPSDVVAGGALGAAAGITARTTARKLGLGATPAAESVGPLSGSEAVLVVSPHSGNSRRLASARRVLDKHGIVVAAELDIHDLGRLPALLRTTDGKARAVIAAGGDGTVGSVAAHLAGTEYVLGILPLGTGNDFARALKIPVNPRAAAELLATGEISDVDLGRLTRADQPPAYFAHAATAGLNVDFARLATRASVRARLGRLTYLVSAVYAVREWSPFTCTLEHDGVVDELKLIQLSVISAPVIGGALGLNLRSPYPDDHRLDVLAVEAVAAPKLLRAGLFLLLGVKRQVEGVRAMHLDRLGVDGGHPLDVTLDGEPGGALPGRFETVAGALRVVTPARRRR